MLPKTRAGGFTLKRNDLVKEELRIRASEAGQWIGAMLDVPSISAAKSPDELLEQLQDGVILCRLIEKVHPESKIRFKADAKPLSFQARDNVSVFISAAKAIGVKASFEPSDLLERKNDKAVLTGLLELSRTVVKFGVKPATIVQFELDISELEKQKLVPEHVPVTAPATAADGDDEDEGDAALQSEDTSVKQSSGNEPTGESAAEPVASTACELKTEPAVAEPADSAVLAASLTAAPDSSASLASSAVATAENAAQPMFRSKGASAHHHHQKKKKAKIGQWGYVPQYLPYNPQAGDEIDQQLAETANRYLLDLDIKPVKILREGREVHLPGEYRISGDWVHVRLLQDTLLVNVANDWVNFIQFCELKLGFQE